MKLYGKSLIFVVFILLLLVIIDFCFNKNNNKEHFNTGIVETIVTDMSPGNGDSSTLITLKGAGFDNVGKIMFNKIAECVILDERTDNMLKIIPPPLSELGKTTEDVREAMNPENPDAKGLEVSIQLVRKDELNNIVGNNPYDTKNVIDIPGLFFYYIDKIPYANSCPEPEVVEPPAVPDQIFEGDNAEVEYPPGSDLEFVNKIVPDRLKELDKLISQLKNKLEEYEHHSTDNIDYLKAIEALTILDQYKQKNNIHRYNVNKRYQEKYF